MIPGYPKPWKSYQEQLNQLIARGMLESLRLLVHILPAKAKALHPDLHPNDAVARRLRELGFVGGERVDRLEIANAAGRIVQVEVLRHSSTSRNAR